MGLGGPAGEPFGGPDTRRRLYLGAALIILMTLVAYTPVFKAGYIWDDESYVTGNYTLRDLEGLRRIWLEPGATPQYYPLVFTSFWVEYRLWQLWPLGYHLDNVVLHGVVAVLLWLLLRRLSVPGAWLGAAIFALHPVHVESVAWITERKNVLSGVFYLAALLAYLRFARVGASAPPPADRPTGASRGRLWYVLALVLFAAALLSKSVTATLPVAILLVLWWKREHLDRRDLLPLVPPLILGAIMASATVWLERHYVGAQGQEWEFSFLQRGLIAGRALWFYARKLLWPSTLTFIYPRWQIDAGLWWQYLFPAAAVVGLVGLWVLRRRVGKAPVVAVLFFTVTLGPALGFINFYPMRYAFVADHFQYLASIGIIALGAGLLARALGRVEVAVAAAWGPGPALSPPGADTGRTASRLSGKWVLPAVLLVVLGTLTWRQARIYESFYSLWRDTAAKNPSSWLAQTHLGNALAAEGRFEEALTHYRQALRLRPNEPGAYNNLGNVLLRVRRVDEAVESYRQALRLDPDNPAAHTNLGNVYASQGRTDQAIAHYTEALRVKPDLGVAHYNLARILTSQGRFQEAIAHYRQVLRIAPDFAAAHNNLGVLLAEQGDVKEAIEHFRQALRLKPDYAEARYYLEAAQRRARE